MSKGEGRSKSQDVLAKSRIGASVVQVSPGTSRGGAGAAGSAPEPGCASLAGEAFWKRQRRRPFGRLGRKA